ncbi:MAG TPA: DUF2752 domain-containing protein, partial [Thermoanaerobaculia bacterium]|nr:DUF2752 domain-containing protein [Thermoanaerobaculia bacterium]
RDSHRPSHPPAGPERWLRLGLVALCFGALAVSAVLAPAPPGAAGGITLAGHRLPELCTLTATTGLPCPGCGLTRSWVSAVHGDLAASLGHHPLGWLVLLYALAQGTRHGAWLAAPRRRGTVECLGARLDRGVILLGALLLVAWIPRLVLIVHRTL